MFYNVLYMNSGVKKALKLIRAFSWHKPNVVKKFYVTTHKINLLTLYSFARSQFHVQRTNIKLFGRITTILAIIYIRCCKSLKI